MAQMLDRSAAEILENDGSGFGRNTLQKELDAMAFTIKRKFDQGVAPEEKESMEKIRTAVESAKEIVDAVWADINE